MTNPFFFGLSIIIHILVIIWNSVLDFLFPNRSKMLFAKQRIHTLIVSGLLIGGVFSFVSFCGVTIMYAAVIDSHSSVNIAERVVPRLLHPSLQNISATAAASNAIETNEAEIYGILFLAFFIFLFSALHGELVSCCVDWIVRGFPFRALFVSFGILVLCVGTASAFIYLTPVTSAASQVLALLKYTEPFPR
ncbi:MAG: hypothetical protein WAN50_02840 [Minisyncoccia bacterium]